MREVEINQEPTELFIILKFENLAASGGEAKTVVAEGGVKVNGEVDTRKRRKIVAGDVIEFGGDEMRIRLRPS
jgi:ribosome-associated protein